MATELIFTKGAIYTDNDFAVRVISRKGDFVTFKNLANNQTFRKKVKVTYVRGESYEVIDIRENWDKGFPIAFHVLAVGILPEFTEQVISRAKEWYKSLYADDDSQPEPATAEITTSASETLLLSAIRLSVFPHSSALALCRHRRVPISCPPGTGSQLSIRLPLSLVLLANLLSELLFSISLSVSRSLDG